MRLDLVQLAAPPGREAEARRFFGELLGLREVEKPPAQKAHPAFVVDDLDALAARLGDVTWDDALPGVRRFDARDPWGSRFEFVQR